MATLFNEVDVAVVVGVHAAIEGDWSIWVRNRKCIAFLSKEIQFENELFDLPLLFVLCIWNIGLILFLGEEKNNEKMQRTKQKSRFVLQTMCPKAVLRCDVAFDFSHFCSYCIELDC